MLWERYEKNLLPNTEDLYEAFEPLIDEIVCAKLIEGLLKQVLFFAKSCYKCFDFCCKSC